MERRKKKVLIPRSHNVPYRARFLISFHFCLSDYFYFIFILYLFFICFLFFYTCLIFTPVFLIFLFLFASRIWRIHIPSSPAVSLSSSLLFPPSLVSSPPRPPPPIPLLSDHGHSQTKRMSSNLPSQASPHRTTASTDSLNDDHDHDLARPPPPRYSTIQNDAVCDVLAVPTADSPRTVVAQQQVDGPGDQPPPAYTSDRYGSLDIFEGGMNTKAQLSGLLVSPTHCLL